MDSRLGFRYVNGKVLIYSDNPSASSPAWAVDIREIIAMLFVGVAALMLLYQGKHEYAMILLTGLLGYATGRTIPGTLAKKENSG